MDKTVKTLGLHWHPASDDFAFKVILHPLGQHITKRVILSEMSRIFDPLGWLSPVTILAKILFQQLWRLYIGWDDRLFDDTTHSWLKYRADLLNIESIRLRRCIVPDVGSRFQLLGFCDASQKAYAAVAYLRCVGLDGQVTVSMVAAKTKVAPTKTISVPRLELCSSLLLARLIKSLKKSMAVEIEAIWCWSDSMVVLCWLASSPDRWKTFVANRVSEICDVIPSSQWNHVRSEENPADCASRGISPSELESHPLWWTGPKWTTAATLPLSQGNFEACDDALAEEKKQPLTVLVTSIVDPWLLTKYSSLTTLQRVTARCQRFIHNIRVKRPERRSGHITVTELTTALHYWVKRIQSDVFGLDIHSIQNGKPLPGRSHLRTLSPFIDEMGVLRVGGRLENANISTDKKHQILLPRNHLLTRLIIDQEHIRLLHAGPQLLMASLQRRFWILCGRDTIRHHVRRCVICTKHRAESAKQMMGNLPALRVNYSRPFLTSPVDYAGPFHLRVLKGRGQKQFKSYIALFVCFTTRAIHLEAVSDLTTGAFIAALQRFVSRRGKCHDLFSDCGTNFVGANRELTKDLHITRTADYNETIGRYLASEGISWKFNPPSAPHQGGLWEAGVKSVKYHLRRIVGHDVLNYEEFTTMLTQVEACLNSRPLCPMSSDPNDLAALTPGHFLIGDALTAIPEPDLMEVPMNRLSRWQLVQKLSQQFWRRWSSEYLSRLQQRPKWWSYRPNLQIGDLVLVKDDNLPPLSWPLGRIIKIHPGQDQQVRVVTVKTANSEFKRPVVKLCHLPIESAPK